MKFLLYGINYSPELTGIGKYSGEMGAWLSLRGHEVRVVTASPYYPDWKVYAGYKNGFSDEMVGRVRVYRCPLFVPATPTTVTRLLHLMSFSLASLVALIRLLRWRPDVVFVVEPTLFCLPGAWLYSRLTGAKLLLHVQDYEIDAMFGLALMKKGRLLRLVHVVESWWMRRLDALSTISQSMMRLAERKGVNKHRIIFFPNWVDTKFITPDADRRAYREQWSIPDDMKVVLYSGNMGKKQGLEIVLDAANHLRNRKDVLFLMVGQGAARAELQEQAVRRELANIRFEPLQPFERLPQLLAAADVHLVVQKKGAADVVLPSKLTGILSAGGVALITAEPETELGLLVDQFPGIATCVEPESLPDFCRGLEYLLETNAGSVNKIARDYALKFLDHEAVLSRFEADVSELLKSSAQG